MLRASRRFTQGFFLRLPRRTPFQSRAIHIHQRIPVEAFSSPVVSNTLRAHLFRVSESTVRTTPRAAFNAAKYGAAYAHCIIFCRRAGLRMAGLTLGKLERLKLRTRRARARPRLCRAISPVSAGKRPVHNPVSFERLNGKAPKEASRHVFALS